MVRFHLNKPGIPQTKEEVFFALVVAVLPSLDSETLLSVYQDADFHTGLGFVSAEVRSHLMSAIADLGPAQRSAINEYSKWVSDRNGRSVVEGGDS